jgi:hypothetical protein
VDHERLNGQGKTSRQAEPLRERRDPAPLARAIVDATGDHRRDADLAAGLARRQR